MGHSHQYVECTNAGDTWNDFEGVLLHTPNYDRDVDLADKHVGPGIIGNGYVFRVVLVLLFAKFYATAGIPLLNRRKSLVLCTPPKALVLEHRRPF
jgi:hypothetical protein